MYRLYTYGVYGGGSYPMIQWNHQRGSGVLCYAAMRPEGRGHVPWCNKSKIAEGMGVVVFHDALEPEVIYPTMQWDWKSGLIFTARVRSTTGRYCFNTCLSFCLSTGGGGLPISHNALQHCPECHGADTGGGGVPGQVQLGGRYRYLIMLCNITQNSMG